MNKKERHVLILAGGEGIRLGSHIPKQFCLLSGKPLLFYTFYAFSHLVDVKFTLVLGAKQVDKWQNLCRTENFNIPHDIVIGGPMRFHSVKSGLVNIPENTLVLIHDAARPFVSKGTIDRVINIAEQKGNATPYMEINDSLREIYGSENKVIDRSRIVSIQTPQGFNSSIIKLAYNQTYKESFTDDASVLESTGMKINMVSGNTDNIKITTPSDFIVAKGLLEYIINQ